MNGIISQNTRIRNKLLILWMIFHYLIQRYKLITKKGGTITRPTLIINIQMAEVNTNLSSFLIFLKIYCELMGQW